ncbi:MAG TPA: glycoside hydrolase family 28 protein [Verrucomicrobiae bacterium]|nr:glycoside hydrolase family 28 protein [Verrucomicrobiae bacterium]
MARQKYDWQKVVGDLQCDFMHRVIFSQVVGFLLGCSVVTATAKTFDVRDFGAKGDGKTKDTAAVQAALDACKTNGGGTVIIAKGDYVIGSVVMGPNTTLELERDGMLNGSPDEADYPLMKTRWEGEFRDCHRAMISAENAANVTVTGPGAIFGPPFPISQLRTPRGPTLLEFINCTNVLLENFATQYQRLWSIHPLYCQNFTARNLTIRSININGDGLDIDSCRNVLIDHCSIDTGDDAISLKSGRGMEAVRIARPTENVVITNCSLVSSTFAGIGIGTELSGGIRNVRIEDCYISGRQNGIYFKSRNGRGGYIENIVGENLLINHAPTFIGIDLLDKGIQATEPVTGDMAQWTQMSNVTFTNIQVVDVHALVDGESIPTDRPVDGLTLANISGTCARGITLANMTNVDLSEIHVTGFAGKLLTMRNVHGVGKDDPEITEK